MKKDDIEVLRYRLKGLQGEELVAMVWEIFGKRVGLASSLGAEDQVLSYMLSLCSKEAHIFTLDTGRMFPEVYDLMSTTMKRMGVTIQVYNPQTEALQEMVNEQGINLFYKSVEMRKHCCHVRKIEPLQRAFAGLDAWICGLRAEQAVTRSHIDVVEWDEVNGLIKINPLAAWTEQELWDYIREHKIPYNPLHDCGYPSIGCQPCTRATEQGEDVRAGRWWWENPDTKECGLHKRG